MSGGNSESVEMYLKTVAELGGDSAPAPIARVAERMGVSPVSASEMMKRLGQQGMVEHLPYKGIRLTEDGLRLANSVIRRQRLWEVFLVDHLKIDWAAAHEMACDLEHATSSIVTEALAEFLDQPSSCPHGNPIPPAKGQPVARTARPLTDVPVGQRAHVRAIAPENSEVLAYVAARGLVPGAEVTVREIAPLQGPLALTVGPRRVDLGLNLAELVLVETDDSIREHDNS
ncbi:MAG: metal-dependent transcriptional regulator [Candidatus Promineifilaceae bacterium]|nr:metal-dependent transcriptional regulator [Candidatus Promineifilaceae bacterium]